MKMWFRILPVVLTIFFLCCEENNENAQESSSKNGPTSKFGKIVHELSKELEMITPKLLPHNPNISVEQYFLTDVSSPSQPCMLELKLVSSEESAPDPWVEERSYTFFIQGLDSVLGDQYVTLYFAGLEAAVGSAYTEYRDRDSNTRDARLFYREDIGFYFLIYPETPGHAEKIAGLFNELKSACSP